MTKALVATDGGGADYVGDTPTGSQGAGGNDNPIDSNGAGSAGIAAPTLALIVQDMASFGPSRGDGNLSWRTEGIRAVEYFA